MKEIEKLRANIEIHNREILAHEAYAFFEVSEFVVLPYTEATGSGVIPVAYSFSKAVIATRV